MIGKTCGQFDDRGLESDRGISYHSLEFLNERLDVSREPLYSAAATGTFAYSVRYTVKLRSPTSGAEPGLSSNSHHSKSEEFIGVVSIETTWRSPLKSFGSWRSQP